jgi:hypothetical protein
MPTPAPAPRTPDAEERKGLSTLIASHLRLAPHDALVLLFSPRCAPEATWLLVEAGRSGVTDDSLLRLVAIEHGDEEGSAARLTAAVEGLRGTGRRIAMLSLEYDTMLPIQGLRELLADPGLRMDAVRVIGCQPDFFSLALATPAEAQRAINAGVLSVLRPARTLEIRTPSGTHLDVQLSPEFQWLSNHGTPQPGRTLVLPAGEVNTYPARIDGTFVADGAINVNRRIAFDVRLDRAPVTVQIEDGHAVDIACDDPDLLRFLRKAFARENADRVGELGVGTNVGITRFVADNNHINERHPGIHLGFGEHGQPGRVAYVADIHIDLITAYGTVAVDGDPTPVVDTAALSESDLPHPDDLRSEDVAGNG